MKEIYDEIFTICTEYGVDFYCTLPCSHNITFIQKLEELEGKIMSEGGKPLVHIPLVREESGVSLCAGAYLGGRKTAMVIQNQGLGNMVTLMLSLNSNLNGSYNIPNLLIISHRGVEGEVISAQKPLGTKTEEILDLVGYKYCSVSEISELGEFRNLLIDYEAGESVALLVKPTYDRPPQRIESKKSVSRIFMKNNIQGQDITTDMTRYEAIATIMQSINDEIVIANLGHPSRELNHIQDRDKNFYLTSCLGHSYTLALGLALTLEDMNQKIVCFEGDGGLLMNPGSLAILVSKKPKNLILVLLDNGVWGSTGNTETYSQHGVNLSGLIQAYGFPESNIKIVSDEQDLSKNFKFALKNEGPFVIHVIINDEYLNVPVLPFSVLEIKDRFKKAIRNNNSSQN